MDPLARKVAARFGQADKTSPVFQALRALQQGGGKVITQGFRRETGRSQPGYGTLRTPGGSVDVWEHSLEALARKGLVKLTKTDSSTNTEHRGVQVWSWTKHWELTPHGLKAGQSTHAKEPDDGSTTGDAIAIVR
jgi:hypothetical protein